MLEHSYLFATSLDRIRCSLTAPLAQAPSEWKQDSSQFAQQSLHNNNNNNKGKVTSGLEKRALCRRIAALPVWTLSHNRLLTGGKRGNAFLR